MLGFALVAWVSSAGSVQMLQTPTATVSPPRAPRATGGEPQPGSGTANQAANPTGAGSHSADLSWVDVLLTTLMLSVALIALVLLARWAWRRRWHRPARPAEVPFDVLPDVARALADDASEQLELLEEGSPRNAIVACWLRLEETADLAGVPRDPAETTAEFTTRVLGALTFDPAMINGFARLYREARFSRHELGEPARRAAVAALRSLYHDISAADITIPPEATPAEVQ